MNKAQQQFGEPNRFIREKVRPFLDPVAQEFIQSSPFAVLATSNERGDCDASPKGGMPGFIRVLDERHLLIPDLAGNRLFQSYENVETNPRAGLIFFIPGCGFTFRVNGRVAVVSAGDRRLAGVAPEVFNPDQKVKVLQGLLLEVEEAYPHCGRSLNFSRLWDAEFIAGNRASRGDAYWTRRWTENRNPQ